MTCVYVYAYVYVYEWMDGWMKLQIPMACLSMQRF